jgi:hypothetical protein
MIGGAEFRLACRGLLLLARFDAGFSRFFDRSAAGALRSFWLAPLIFPLHLLHLWLSEAKLLAADATQFLLAMSLGYAFRWIVPPLLIAWIAPLIDRDAEMPGCIAIYNWQSLLSVGLALPLILLEIGGVPSMALAIPYSLVLVVSLVWQAFLLTHALRIPLWQGAIGTIIDYVLTFWIMAPVFLALGGVSWS